MIKMHEIWLRRTDTGECRLVDVVRWRDYVEEDWCGGNQSYDDNRHIAFCGAEGGVEGEFEARWPEGEFPVYTAFRRARDGKMVPVDRRPPGRRHPRWPPFLFADLDASELPAFGADWGVAVSA